MLLLRYFILNNLNNLEATLKQRSKTNLGNKPAKPLQKEARKSHRNIFEVAEESKVSTRQENEKQIDGRDI